MVNRSYENGYYQEPNQLGTQTSNREDNLNFRTALPESMLSHLNQNFRDETNESLMVHVQKKDWLQNILMLSFALNLITVGKLCFFTPTAEPHTFSSMPATTSWPLARFEANFLGSDISASAILGTWHCSQISGDTVFYPDNRCLMTEHCHATGTWSLDGRQVTVKWSNGWTAVYALSSDGQFLLGHTSPTGAYGNSDWLSRQPIAQLSQQQIQQIKATISGLRASIRQD